MAEMSGKVIRYNLETEVKHGIQVSNLAYAVGMELRLPKEQCYDLAVAGMLHDIGKLRLSRYVSGDRNPLVIEEIKYVRRHTQLGYEILKERGYSKFILEAIYYHHENYDGSGYPENLEGENIPLGSRILRICDTYAALTEKRPYRDAFSSSQAVRIMIDEVKNFDMQVFLAFQRVVHNEEERGEMESCS
ncbi:MAG: HD domain-containing protein [Firmicutes bacterium]|nr:HD domain-containing protein [Bacillota bacterium]